MDFYGTTLKGMKKVLDDCKENTYADIVGNCLAKWQSDKDVNCMLTEFSDSGRFRTFKFDPTDFSSAEQAFWTNQLFGGLVAMMIQLGRFILDGRNVNMDFIRSNFGCPSEILSGHKCTSCGTFMTAGIDIDKYVSLPIIAKRITDGLENGNIEDEIEPIISMTAPEIEMEKSRTKVRCLNTNIMLLEETPVICPSCESNKLKSCRFLKSMRSFTFVPLNS